MPHTVPRKWSVVLTLAALFHIGLGLWSLFLLRRDVASVAGWFFAISLPVGLGLMQGKAWARRVGMVYNTIFFIGMVRQSYAAGQPQNDVRFLFSLMLLVLVTVLYKYPADEGSSATRVSDGGEGTADEGLSC